MEKAPPSPDTEVSAPLDHIECQAVWNRGGGLRLGDLHVLPDGVFFLAHPSRLSWLADPQVAGGITGGIWSGLAGFIEPLVRDVDFPLGAIILLVLLALGVLFPWWAQRKGKALRAQMHEWRAGLGGRPLDQLVEELKGAWWIRPDEMQAVRLTKDRITIHLSKKAKHAASGLRPLQTALITQRAREWNWPVVKPPSHPPHGRCKDVVCQISDSAARRGQMILTTEGIAFLPNSRRRWPLEWGSVLSLIAAIPLLIIALIRGGALWWILFLAAILAAAGCLIPRIWFDRQRRRQTRSVPGLHGLVASLPAAWWLPLEQVVAAELHPNTLYLSSMNGAAIQVSRKLDSNWSKTFEVWARIFLWDRMEVVTSEE
ncbi:hypothetical protein JXA47_06390 [Candidatus Sumerlaeota bacterium]|nr:hypothetical protein [Candidatus Sumerlaeota bacterium]